MKTRTKYFAYGSHMSTERIRSRIHSAHKLCIGYIKNKRMLFNKRSSDGSGKANIVNDTGYVTWGVVYDVTYEDLEKLDEIERGYSREYVKVYCIQGNIILAATYVSTELTGNPVPRDSYKHIVLKGAREHELPESYIDYIDSFPSMLSQ